jgi:methionine-gamma-lyase
MSSFEYQQGLGTLATHVGEGENPYHAHITPLYQTSTFSFPDVATGAALFRGEEAGYIYTRLGNPNLAQLAEKIAVLEGIDLLRANPSLPVQDVVQGEVFGSGMAAITSAILARVKPGDTVIAQDALYSATYTFLHDLSERCGFRVVWLIDDFSAEAWEKAFAQNPGACLAYAETPANPTMRLVDLAAVAEIAHRYNAWLMVDNTFASPYCQRPLSLGADVVVHSTTKYISGHGLVVGGAVVSRHPHWMRTNLHAILKVYGGTAGPFDAWLTNIGLKTFEVRMERHCQNALAAARYLESHPAVGQVYYPGLESDPHYELAKRQMLHFGGMISFELKGGLQAGIDLMNRVKVCTLAVSLGNVDTLIQHPASMTHSTVPAEARLKMGLSDGLVRLSVGIENIEDILNDFEQAFRP